MLYQFAFVTLADVLESMVLFVLFYIAQAQMYSDQVLIQRRHLFMTHIRQFRAPCLEVLPNVRTLLQQCD